MNKSTKWVKNIGVFKLIKEKLNNIEKNLIIKDIENGLYGEYKTWHITITNNTYAVYQMFVNEEDWRKYIRRTLNKIP